MLKKEMTMITAPNNSLRKTISGIFLEGDSRFAIFDLTDTELPINYEYFQKDENGFYGFGSIGKYDEWIDDTSLKIHQENLSELINQLKQYGIHTDKTKVNLMFYNDNTECTPIMKIGSNLDVNFIDTQYNNDGYLIPATITENPVYIVQNDDPYAIENSVYVNGYKCPSERQ